jgi:hypothetical protein
MNVLSVISVILGIISVMITLKYVKYYDSFDKHLHKLTLRDGNEKTIFLGLVKIQDELDISDITLDSLLQKNYTSIVKLLRKSILKSKTSTSNSIKKESFVNYNYIDHKQRDLKHFKFTSLIN